VELFILASKFKTELPASVPMSLRDYPAAPGRLDRVRPQPPVRGASARVWSQFDRWPARWARPPARRVRSELRASTLSRKAVSSVGQF